MSEPATRPLIELLAKYSERKTIHEWLNDAGIPQEENGKPICLIRRLRIALDELKEYRKIEKLFESIDQNIKELSD